MKGTVVFISMVHWHFTWQLEHSFARGLAERGYNVRFVEPLPKRWPALSELGRVWGRLAGHSETAGNCYQPLVPGVELVSPRLLPDTNPLLQSLNRRLFVPRIADTLRHNVTHPLIVVNYLPLPASLALMEQLRPDATFYHCVNDWDHDPYTSTGHFKEAELAGAVDMVWTDSPVNYARNAAWADNVILMSHVVDVELFAQARRTPGEPPARPLCAYFGTIGISADIDLLRAVSHRYRLRLIGPVRAPLEGFAADTELIAPVPQGRLPELLRDVDVLLLPYVRSVHNQGVMPAKIFECMATGKPMVVSGLTALDQYADLLYLCEGESEFLASIAEAVHEPSTRRAARIACAEANSNQRRIDEIEGYFRQALAAGQPQPAPVSMP